MAARKGPVYRCVSTVFTGSGDACARAFDAQSGVLQRVFRGHTFVINCLQVGFSPPSSLLPPGKQEASHRGNPSGLLMADSGPACPQVHGQVLYTASHDGALRFWDVRGLQSVPPLPRRPAAKRSLSRLFSNKVACAAPGPLQPA